MSSSEITKLETRWQENPQGLTFAPLAEAYRKLREPQRALEVLAQGLARHPDYIPASIVLGRRRRRRRSVGCSSSTTRMSSP